MKRSNDAVEPAAVEPVAVEPVAVEPVAVEPAAVKPATMEQRALPSVVIVGRPNVGKSTLYNRLIGGRRAITHPNPGVTRDVLEARWRVGDRWVALRDTAGLWNEGAKETEGDRRQLERLVAERSFESVRSADLLLLVLDIEGLTALDQLLIERLRPYSERVICLVNKVDNERREHYMADFHAIGFSAPIPISAEHGRNIDQIGMTVAEMLATRPVSASSLSRSEAVAPSIGLAIVGRPNTGKSTLINALTRRSISLVSEMAGTTRDVVEADLIHNGMRFHLLDTAGMRKRRRVADAVEYYSVQRAISAIAEADIVLLLIDAVEGLATQDKKIANFAVERGKGVILLLNKWDLLERVPNRLQAMRDRIDFLFPVVSFAPLVPISAKETTGFDLLFAAISRVWRQLGLEITTGRLNRYLARWVADHPPHRLKLRYIVQTGTHPIRFLLFVNHREHLTGNHLSWLRNRIRADLGLVDIPFQIEIRSSSSAQ